MGWQDRDYSPGRENMSSYLANPSNLLGMSFPLFRGRSLHVRMHFWFLVALLFSVADLIRGQQSFPVICVETLVWIGVVLLHEAAHYTAAKMVDGTHWEWILWPYGGMTVPVVPRRPRAVFWSAFGGVLGSAIIGVLAYVAIRLIPETSVGVLWHLDPFSPIVLLVANPSASFSTLLLLKAFQTAAMTSFTIAILNLFPSFWFDGGHIWQAILWPKFGSRRAMSMTCMAGMVLGVPVLLLSFLDKNFLGVVVWFLLIADCYNRRRLLAIEGPAGLGFQDEPEYDYMDTKSHRPVIAKRSVAAARKRVKAEQSEQAKIDAILDKVKEKGLHSLSWGEKRTLKQATERQRQRDVRNRL